MLGIVRLFVNLKRGEEIENEDEIIRSIHLFVNGNGNAGLEIQG